jgi:hypothetical protein
MWGSPPLAIKRASTGLKLCLTWHISKSKQSNKSGKFHWQQDTQPLWTHQLECPTPKCTQALWLCQQSWNHTFWICWLLIVWSHTNTTLGSNRNCTILSRYSVGFQWHYTCRRQVMDLLMQEYWLKSSVCIEVSTLNKVMELVSEHLILFNFAVIYS